MGYYSAKPLKNAVAQELLPQRPHYVREQAEPAGHILEPEWKGLRVIVRVGQDGPRFTGYTGPIDGPRELFDAIVADTKSSSAIFDGVLVDAWQDEAELEMDGQGNALARPAGSRRIFAAFEIGRAHV